MRQNVRRCTIVSRVPDGDCASLRGEERERALRPCAIAPAINIFQLALSVVQVPVPPLTVLLPSIPPGPENSAATIPEGQDIVADDEIDLVID